MRIALISTPYLPVPPRRYGGTELIVYELAEGLVRRGHRVELFATGDSRTNADLRSLYRTAQWPPQMLADLNHVSWAMQQIGQHGPFDVVHAHSAVALACARFLPTVPLVYTLHHCRDAELSRFYQGFPDAHYIAISDDQRRREVALRNVHVIHHGLDPARYAGATQPLGNYVCFVGRYARVKGPHTAIDVARTAGVPIRLAGEAHLPDEAWANAELRTRLAQPHVTDLGPVGPDVKVPLLAHARALLAPIEWHEPFGLILIEAMLCGCPVVAFGMGSVPELVENGVTGFIATSPEHMVELIRPGGAVDGIDRVRCRRRAVERFSADRMVADHVALYERVRTAARALPARTTPSSVVSRRTGVAQRHEHSAQRS
jgi:glycosyltransferase involved in cell wall biosynthesis